MKAKTEILGAEHREQFFLIFLPAILCFLLCALRSGSCSFQPCSLSGDKTIKTLNHGMDSKCFCKIRIFIDIRDVF